MTEKEREEIRGDMESDFDNAVLFEEKARLEKNAWKANTLKNLAYRFFDDALTLERILNAENKV